MNTSKKRLRHSTATPTTLNLAVASNDAANKTTFSGKNAIRIMARYFLVACNTIDIATNSRFCSSKGIHILQVSGKAFHEDGMC